MTARAMLVEEGVDCRPVVCPTRGGALEQDDPCTLVLEDRLTQDGFVLGQDIRRVLVDPHSVRRVCQGILPTRSRAFPVL